MAQLKNTTVTDTGFIKLPTGTTAQRPSPSNGKVRFNSTTGKLEFYNNVVNEWLGTTETGVIATGGNSVYDIDVEGTTYRVHVFTTTGNSNFTVTKGGEVECLIVAGGGGGGGYAYAGGGGGGGVLMGLTNVTPQTYTVTVGANGLGGARFTQGGDGGNSSFNGLVANGGGGGGSQANNPNVERGRDGGSGGGSSMYYQHYNHSGWDTSMGVSTQNNQGSLIGYGNNGGRGRSTGSSSSGYPGGGGGGAGNSGEDGVVSIRGGNGGNGIVSFISGIPTFYAGGGGGGVRSNISIGIGGLGGGANGIAWSGLAPAGLPNTGGGGGGGTGNTTSRQSNTGGSGIIIIRYPLRQENPTTATGKVIGDGLVLDLDFSKPTVYSGSGTIVTDSRLNGITGTLTNGPVFTDRRTHRSSFSFDGVDDGIQLPGSSLSVNQMTISSWNFSSNYVQSGFMFEKTTNGTVNTQYSLFYNGDSSAHLYFRTYGLSTTDLFLSFANSGVTNNQWNNVVATWDGTNKRIYVNGSLKATSANLTGTVTQNITGPAYIGIYGNFAGYPFNGNIAKTQIYNRALTATEVLQGYNATKWRFGL